MSLKKLLFSTEGRIPRSIYWYYLLGYLAALIMAPILDVLLGTIDEQTGAGLFSNTLAMIGLITTTVVAVKRSHDRNHSTKWLLLCSLVPIFNLWVALELGFLQGTDGDNRYGPDPLHMKVISKKASLKPARGG